MISAKACSKRAWASGVESDSWKEQPEFQHLSPERQAIVEEGVVELLFVWAQVGLLLLELLPCIKGIR